MSNFIRTSKNHYMLVLRVKDLEEMWSKLYPSISVCNNMPENMRLKFSFLELERNNSNPLYGYMEVSFFIIVFYFRLKNILLA